MDISSEIKFQTARSGGSGGQNVNKVETMVIGKWNPTESAVLTVEQRARILHKLAKQITQTGELLVKSQEARTQLENKSIVIAKMTQLIANALKKEKPRIATRPTNASKEKRLDSKKKRADVKSSRGRIKW